LEVTDQELVRLAVRGDDAAFHALVDRHAPALLRSAVVLSRNRADAEDLLQDTLVAAYRGLKGFAGRSSVKTWLVKILSRKAFKALKRNRPRQMMISLDAARQDGPELASAKSAGSIGSVERRLDVMQVLQMLSLSHREILVLREIQGMSYDEIASALMVPRGTVESRLFRARAEFKQSFGDINRETARLVEKKR
jgi:RNA polymerase sigma-70 factor, ECF subfamily